MVGNYTADLGPRPLCARLLPVSFKSVDPFLGPFFFLCAFCFSFPTFLFEARTLSVFPRCKGAGRHHIIIIIIIEHATPLLEQQNAPLSNTARHSSLLGKR